MPHDNLISTSALLRVSSSLYTSFTPFFTFASFLISPLSLPHPHNSTQHNTQHNTDAGKRAQPRKTKRGDNDDGGETAAAESEAGMYYDDALDDEDDNNYKKAKS